MSRGKADFAAIYANHGPAVYRFALYLCGEPAEAEDVAAETFARAWTSPSPIAAETVRSYLFTIARNVYVQRAKKIARHEPLDGDVAPSASAEDRLDARDELRSVDAHLRRLPADDRAAVLMRAAGSSYEEIATALGTTPAAARVRVHRVRALLTRARMRGSQP